MRMRNPGGSLSLLIAIVAIITLSCAHAEAELAELNDQFAVALASSDRDALMAVSTSITDDDIRGRLGLDFLKLKLAALTFGGAYDLAWETLALHVDQFDESAQLLMAGGLIQYHLGRDGTISFLEAYSMLNHESMDRKSDDEKVMEFYLALVLDDSNSAYVRNILYSSMSEIARTAADAYAALSRQDLLLSPPIGFVANRPIPSDFPDPATRWWE